MSGTLLAFERPSKFIMHHDTMTLGADGHRQFHQPVDRLREDRLGEIVRQHFNLERMVYLGNKSYVDFIAIRGGTAVAGIEFISRNATFEDLIGHGGPYIKTTSLKILQEIAGTPWSIKWKGIWLFYDLQDGLYFQEVRAVRGAPELMEDSRQAQAQDTEPGFMIYNLEKIFDWTEAVDG